MNPSTSAESKQLQIVIEDKDPNVRVLRINGALLLSNLFEFQGVSRQDTARSVLIDLTNVPYMDSAGLGSIISVYTSCQRTNRKFGMVGLTERIQTLLQVASVDGLLPIYATEQAALAAF